MTSVEDSKSLTRPSTRETDESVDRVTESFLQNRKISTNVESKVLEMLFGPMHSEKDMKSRIWWIGFSTVTFYVETMQYPCVTF